MDRAKLFTSLRPIIGKLSQTQVDGVGAILDACDEEGVTDLRHIAYLLATPMIETEKSTYLPGVESLNYSSASLTAKFPSRITATQAVQYGRTTQHPADQKAIGNIIYGGPWGKANLGNTEVGDGFLYRGRGLVQITGRRLYTLFGFAINPDGACDLEAAADIMVRGMRDGLFTGKKLSDYLSGAMPDWRNARRIVNGVDRADDIAGYAVKIYGALKAAV
jgi:predicted chitinase